MRLVQVYIVFATLLLGCGTATKSGYSSGPFVKINDLWLVYTNPSMHLKNGRLMLPARYFAAVAGIGFYASDSKSVVLRFRGQNLRFRIGSRDVVIGGQSLPIDQEAYVAEGRVMVPLAVVARAFNLEIRWSSADKVVQISGVGLASEQPFIEDALGPIRPAYIYISARIHLIDYFLGSRPIVPEVTGIRPVSFSWKWVKGVYPSGYVRAKTVDLSKGSGFRVVLHNGDSSVGDVSVVFGLGVDSPTAIVGFWVRGIGRFGIAYPGERVPDDREYCRSISSSRLLCEVDAGRYTNQPFLQNASITRYSIPRFVFLRAYKK